MRLLSVSSGAATWVWAVVALISLLAPSPSVGVLDGIPLDGAVDVVVVGVIVPLLLLLHAHVFATRWARALVLLLAIVKVLAIAFLTTAGFCTEFRADRPVVGPVAMIDIAEPSGLMRSWDVRAHLGAGVPRCSAITRRDYLTRSRFPAWFTNITEHTADPPREVTMTMHGVVTVEEPGTLAFDAVPGEGAELRVNGESSPKGTPLTTTLTAGTHAVELRVRLTGDRWRVVPSWNGQSLWSSALVTIDPPRPLDRALSRVVPIVVVLLAGALIIGWIASAVRHAPLDGSSLGRVATLTLAMLMGGQTWLARFVPLGLALVAFTPAARRPTHWRTLAWLIAVPWMTWVAVQAWPQLDEFTRYSVGDDWHTYQVSAYRIYLQGYWLEAGEKLFYYQPFYRWIAGALHVVFGDSSLGEVIWDGGGLLVAAFVVVAICRPLVSGPVVVAGAALTLAVFTITPIWFLIGRGLAEISAAAFSWLALLWLLHARSVRSVAVAGGLGVLAYFTRLNHMLFAGALVAYVLPLTVQTRSLGAPTQLAALVPWRRVVTYAAVLLTGLGLLSLRSWFYTGETSPFAGTSFGLNHTGLTPGTLFSLDVWQRIGHNLLAQAMANETFDVRGLPILAGCVAALLALLQLPRFARLPLALTLSILGGLAGAFVAHAHGYPARFSVHLVPLALAAVTILIDGAIGSGRAASPPITDFGAPPTRPPESSTG